MGIKEAKEDGIKCHFDETAGYRNGKWIYEIPCAYCGRIQKYRIYSRKKTYACKRCSIRVKEKERIVQEAKEPAVFSKHERRFLRAAAEVKAKERRPGEYDKAIEAAAKRLDRYDSIPEAMVAIELLRLGYKIIPQQKIGRYRVDFVIPEEKIALEVDGELYHRTNQRAMERELLIQYALGEDWRIIHIPSEMIAESIRKLRPCIKRALKLNEKML